MSTPRSWSRGGRRQVDKVGWSQKVTEMGQGADKDEKGKKGGHTMTVSILDHPPGGLLETLDQFRILTEVAQHLSSDTFALTVKKRLRDQLSLPGWEQKDEHLWYRGHIYVPEPLCLQLICNHHDHPMVGHFGHLKTIDLICWSCHWPGLTQMVKQYIQSCMVCAHSKANQHKPYGFLKQLPIPS